MEEAGHIAPESDNVADIGWSGSSRMCLARMR